MNSALQNTSVVLPCEPDHFRDFVAGLLGKPQTIGRVIGGPFEVRSTNVDSLYSLIQQRLTSQNEAELIQFTVRITYNDNSSVLLTSYEDFKNYAEVKPLISVGLALSWTFLVKFRNKRFPERQQIDLRFLTQGSIHPRGRTTVYSAALIEEILPIWSGYMELRITHTDRTWATDIDSLIAGHLELLRKDLIGLKRLVTDHAGKLGWLAFGMAASISGFGIWKITAGFADVMHGLLAIHGPTSTRTIEELGARIDTLTQFVANGGWEKFTFLGFIYGVLALIGSIAIGIFVGTSADFSRPSFVLLTDKADELRVAALNRVERGPSKIVIGLIGSIVLSIIASFLFNLLARAIS